VLCARRCLLSEHGPSCPGWRCRHAAAATCTRASVDSLRNHDDFTGSQLPHACTCAGFATTRPMWAPTT
jgi:hypothetical protein